MLSARQTEFIKYSTAKLNFAHGSVRSGKTHATLLRWAEFVYNCPDDKLIMIGKSSDSIYDNAVKPFMNEMFKGYCTWSPGRRVLNFAGKDIRVIGANDQGAVGRIQGNTISGAYVDEMTILPQNFLDMLFSRLSLPHSLLIGTMNPDSPFHPLKRLIDMADGKQIYALKFDLNDNPALTDDYKKMLDTLYVGLWRRRFILGEWCLAEGAIYDFFDRKYHVLDRPPGYAQQYIAAIDYGTSNPLCLLVCGFNPNVSPSIWVEKEYYYDPKVFGRQRTDSEFADDIERELYGLGCRSIYLDPSAASLEVELRKRKVPVKHANNDVLNGIRLVSDYFVQGDLAVLSSCTNLIKEIESYTWDEKKVLQGIDAPKKVNDHACDSLRYLIMSHFHNKRLKPTQTKETPKNLMNVIGFGDGHGWQSFGGSPGR